MCDGSHISPQAVGEAISFKADHKTTQVLDFREGEPEELESKARRLLPELREIRKNLGLGQGEARSRLHIPLLKELLKIDDMGGATWCDQFADGFPTLGELAEPGAYPLSSLKMPGPISGEKLFQSGASRFEPARGGTEANSPRLWKEAQVQVAQGWQRGPRKFNPHGGIDFRRKSYQCGLSLPSQGTASC